MPIQRTHKSLGASMMPIALAAAHPRPAFGEIVSSPQVLNIRRKLALAALSVVKPRYADQNTRQRIRKLLLLFGAWLFAGLANAQSVSNAAQLKKTITVASFEIRGAGAEIDPQLGEMLADQLSDALIQSDAFIVLERESAAAPPMVGGYEYSQDAYATADPSQMPAQPPAPTAARPSQAMQSQLLIKAAVTSYSHQAGGNNNGLMLAGVRVGANKAVAQIGMTLRLIDTITNQVLESRRVEGKIESKGMKLAVERQEGTFESDTYKASPMGKVSQLAIDEAAAFIAEQSRQLSYTARVVKVDDRGRAIISCGGQSGVQPGMRFRVMSMLEELTDPITGEVLGYDQEELGTVTVARVLDRIAYTDAVAGMKVGDIVVLQ